MDKGIRPAMIAAFNAALPQRENTTKGNTAFRKGVMAGIMEAFGITLASAATHYNHAFIEAKKVPELAPLLVGLGRPEDKKGGRKPKPKTDAAPAEGATIADVLLSNVLQAREGNEGGDAPADEAPKQEEVLQLEAPKLVRVCKVADGTVVAEGLTEEAAQKLIDAAKAAKKSKLHIA